MNNSNTHGIEQALQSVAQALRTNGIGSYYQSYMPAGFGTAASSTWQDTGLEITLPSAGIYLLTFSVRASLTAGQWVVVKGYNSTAGADVSPSTTTIISVAAGSEQQSTSKSQVIVVAAPSVIKLQAKPGGAYAVTIASDVNGYITMDAVRIG